MYYVIAGLRKESYGGSPTPRRYMGWDNEPKLLSFLQLQHRDKVPGARPA
jgi:hypothetical protein